MAEEKEIWKDVVGYEGLYQVSNYGTVRSLDRVNHRGHKYKGRVLKKYTQSTGYYIANLSKAGKQKAYTIHKLVALAFIPNPESKKEVNHINGDKKDNSICNLEWVCRSENESHAYLTGLKKSGEEHHFSKLTESQVLNIRTIHKIPYISYKEIARMYGVSYSLIFLIVHNKLWKHI